MTDSVVLKDVVILGIYIQIHKAWANSYLGSLKTKWLSGKCSHRNLNMLNKALVRMQTTRRFDCTAPLGL